MLIRSTTLVRQSQILRTLSRARSRGTAALELRVDNKDILPPSFRQAILSLCHELHSLLLASHLPSRGPFKVIGPRGLSKRLFGCSSLISDHARHMGVTVFGMPKGLARKLCRHVPGISGWPSKQSLHSFLRHRVIVSLSSAPFSAPIEHRLFDGVPQVHERPLILRQSRTKRQTKRPTIIVPTTCKNNSQSFWYLMSPPPLHRSSRLWLSDPR